MFFKLPVFIFVLCVLILPVIESRKSKNQKSKSKKLSVVKPDKDTCEFLGYEGPEDDKHRKKNKVRLEVRGPVPAVYIPLTDDGEINYPVIPKYVKHLNSTGATAILVGGISGECFSITTCERKKVTEAYFNETKKYGIKIIVHVGGIEMPYVLELARHAEKLGVAAILTTPPICSLKPKSLEDLIWYLTVISKYAPSLPLLYYHYPEYTGVYINEIRKFHTKLSTQIGNYKGMLTNFLVALEIADLVRRDQEIFLNSHYVAPAAFMGFESSINPIHNIVLEEVHEILNAVKTGASKKARKLQLKINKIFAEIEAVAGIVPATKTCMEITTDIEVGPVRPPMPRITKKERKTICDILENNAIETNCYNSEVITL